MASAPPPPATGLSGAAAGQAGYVTNVPDFKVTLDGQDLTPKMRPRLVSLTLSDKRAGEADQLDIVLDDSDGRLALPKAGAKISLQLGWKRGSDVTPGLVEKGSFTVDEVEHGGPPDQVTIRARSADFTSEIRTRREKSWKDTTLGAVVNDIASRNKLQPRCASSLASISIKSLVQGRESDIAFLRRLGRRYDAVATIKKGALIFSPVGAGATPGGRAIPSIEIRRRDGDRHSYRLEKREEGEGVTATWHDRKAAKKKDVTIGKKDGARKLSHVYATEDSAKRAARAERSRLGRRPEKLSFDLALGRAELYPERRVKAVGFKAEIDAKSWLIVEVTHSLTNTGFSTKLEMEAAS
ncbi:MAG TPA: contractile injection system protein, VgrG/Pvc8 family [Allosphingosinicella sp.]|uniref:contractile injection system protein, VgrG/Pvc8 family n=1 Tax=Allosphingosinicella sp. TaxID=2823234 RepID=UPI002ED9EF57